MIQINQPYSIAEVDALYNNMNTTNHAMLQTVTHALICQNLSSILDKKCNLNNFHVEPWH